MTFEFARRDRCCSLGLGLRLSLVLVAACCVGWNSDNKFAIGQEKSRTADDLATPVSAEAIALVTKLKDPHYSARELADAQLLRLGEEAIPALEKGLENADADQSARMVRLLSELAIEPKSGPGPAALQSLNRVANSVITMQAVLASKAPVSLREHQKILLEQELQKLGARSGTTDVQVMSTLRDAAYIMILDSAFRGDTEDLFRLEWMYGLEHLILDGPQVDGDWLEHVGNMPNLKILQIRRANLKADDFKKLEQLESLETLEILYTPIDDTSIQGLGKLPIASNLRIFGTKITPQGVDQLKGYLTGIEILYGRGGFLGVSMSPGSSVIGALVPNGAAQKYGLQPGDRIMSINSRTITKFEELQLELANYTPGMVVEVRIQRIIRKAESIEKESIELTVPVELGEQR